MYIFGYVLVREWLGPTVLTLSLEGLEGTHG